MAELQTLPRVRDSWSFLYVEHCRVEQENRAIAIFDKDGKVCVPCAALLALLVGPGTTLTHAAVRALATMGVPLPGLEKGAFGFTPTGSGRRVHPAIS